jgi:hypothetical protein
MFADTCRLKKEKADLNEAGIFREIFIGNYFPLRFSPHIIEKAPILIILIIGAYWRVL